MEAHCGKGDPPRDWEHFLVAKIKTKLQTVLYLQDATGEGREILPETESRGGGEGGPGKGEEKGRRGSGTRKEGAMRGPGRKGKDDGKWGDGRRVLGGLGRVVGRGRARKVIEQATEGMPGWHQEGMVFDRDGKGGLCFCLCLCPCLCFCFCLSRSPPLPLPLPLSLTPLLSEAITQQRATQQAGRRRTSAPCSLCCGLCLCIVYLRLCQGAVLCLFTVSVSVYIK